MLAWNFVLVFSGLFPRGIGSIFFEKYFVIIFIGLLAEGSARGGRETVTLHPTFLSAL